MVPVFHGQINDAATRILWDADAALPRLRWMKTLAGERVEVIIRKARAKRSLDQNSYWHGVVFPLVSEYTGYTIPETKLVLLGECFGWQKIGGHDVPIKPSTSDLTVEEGSRFTEFFGPWAVEHCGGLQIPLPNEVAA